MQIAALVGIWGITFAITWFASTTEWVWSRNFEWNTVRTPLLACGCVLGGLVLAGALRVALAGTEGASLRVATLNRPVDLFVPGEMAAFRAIENGVPMVRPATSGVSSAVDPWGRMVAFSDYFAGGDRTMTAQVPITHTWTLYPRVRDLFAWSCGVAVVVAVAIALMGRV